MVIVFELSALVPFFEAVAKDSISVGILVLEFVLEVVLVSLAAVEVEAPRPPRPLPLVEPPRPLEAF